MNTTQEKWMKPEVEIISFGSEDVIRTSGETGGVRTEESGFGDVTGWSDLFG